MSRIRSLSATEELICVLYELVCPMIAADECVKCVVTDGSFMFTTDVEQLLSCLDIEHPAVEIVIQAVKAHKIEHRTGAKTLLFMMTRLAKAIIQLQHLGISTHKSLAIVQTAVAQLIKEVEEISWPVTDSTFSLGKHQSSSHSSQQTDTSVPQRISHPLNNGLNHESESNTWQGLRCRPEIELRPSLVDDEVAGCKSYNSAELQCSTSLRQQSGTNTVESHAHQIKSEKGPVGGGRIGPLKQFNEVTNQIFDGLTDSWSGPAVQSGHLRENDITPDGQCVSDMPLLPFEIPQNVFPIDTTPSPHWLSVNCNDSVHLCNTDTMDNKAGLGIGHDVTASTEADPVFLKMVDVCSSDSGQEDIDWFFDQTLSSPHHNSLSQGNECTPDNMSPHQVLDPEPSVVSSAMETCQVLKQSKTRQDLIDHPMLTSDCQDSIMPLSSQVKVSSSKDNDQHDSDFEDCFDDVDNRKHFKLVVEPIAPVDCVIWDSPDVSLGDQVFDKVANSHANSHDHILLHNVKKHYFSDLDFDDVSDPSFQRSESSEMDDFDACFSDDLTNLQPGHPEMQKSTLGSSNLSSFPQHMIETVTIKETICDPKVNGQDRRGKPEVKHKPIDAEFSEVSGGGTTVAGLTQALKSLGANKPVRNISASSRHFQHSRDSPSEDTKAVGSKKGVCLNVDSSFNDSKLAAAGITSDIQSPEDNPRHYCVSENNEPGTENPVQKTPEMSQGFGVKGPEESEMKEVDPKALHKGGHPDMAEVADGTYFPGTVEDNRTAVPEDSSFGQQSLHRAGKEDPSMLLNQLLSKKKQQFKSAMSKKVLLSSRHLADDLSDRNSVASSPSEKHLVRSACTNMTSPLIKTPSHSLKTPAVPVFSQSQSGDSADAAAGSHCGCHNSRDVRHTRGEPAPPQTGPGADWRGCHGNIREVAKQVFEDQMRGHPLQSFNLHLIDCISLPVLSSSLSSSSSPSSSAAAATSSMGSACSVQGLVLSCHVTVLEVLQNRQAASCSQRTLLINADLRPTFHHKGYRPTLGKRSFVTKTFESDGETEAHKWSMEVLRTIQQLEVQVLLVKGQVSSVLSEMCTQAGVLVIPHVRYHTLCVLSHLLRTDIITYVAQATQASVCKICLKPLTVDWMDQLSPTDRKSHSPQVSLLHIHVPGVQTVVLHSPCELSARLGEEKFWKYLHRYVNAHRDGQVLPAGAATELWSAKHIQRDASQALVNGSVTRSVVLEALAEVFMDFYHRVQFNTQHLECETVATVTTARDSSSRSTDVGSTDIRSTEHFEARSSVLRVPTLKQKPTEWTIESDVQPSTATDSRDPKLFDGSEAWVSHQAKPCAWQATDSQTPELVASSSSEIWDNYQAKLSAWQTAVDVTSVLSNLGSLVTTGVDESLAVL